MRRVSPAVEEEQEDEKGLSRDQVKSLKLRQYKTTQMGDVRLSEQEAYEEDQQRPHDAQLTQRIRNRMAIGDPAVHEYMFEAQDWQFVVDSEGETRTIRRNIIGPNGTFERITYPAETSEFEILMDVRRIARIVNREDFLSYESGFIRRNPALYPATITANPEPGSAEATRVAAQRYEAYTNWMRAMGAKENEISAKWWREAVYNTVQPGGYMEQGLAAIAAGTVAVKGTNIMRNGQPNPPVAIRPLGPNSPPRPSVTAHTMLPDKTKFPVWYRVTATQQPWNGTVIPKSFVLQTASDQRIWVHPNATEHLAERVQPNKSVALSTMMQQAQLQSLDAAVNQVTQTGVPYGKIVTTGGWELKFAPPRPGAALPVLFHAKPLE